MALPSISAFDGTPQPAFRGSIARARRAAMSCKWRFDYPEWNFGDTGYGIISAWDPFIETQAFIRQISWRPAGDGNSGEQLFYDPGALYGWTSYMNRFLIQDGQAGAFSPIVPFFSFDGVWSDSTAWNTMIGPYYDNWDLDRGTPYISTSTWIGLANSPDPSLWGPRTAVSFRRGKYKIDWSLNFHPFCHPGTWQISDPDNPQPYGLWSNSPTATNTYGPLFLPLRVTWLPLGPFGASGYFMDSYGGSMSNRALAFDAYTSAYRGANGPQTLNIPENRDDPNTLWYAWGGNASKSLWPEGVDGGLDHWCHSDIKIGVITLDNILPRSDVQPYPGAPGYYLYPDLPAGTILATQTVEFSRL
jgi:hypothetical protein